MKDIYKNAYFTGSNFASFVDFRTRLFGLFKINIYLNDSKDIYEGKDIYIKYINTNSKGRILKNNGEYYFYVEVPSEKDLFDEDGEQSELEYYRMEVMLVDNQNKKFRVEFVQEKMYLSEEEATATSIMDTFKNALDAGRYDCQQSGAVNIYKNKIPIKCVSYEINTTFDISGKTIKVYTDDARVQSVRFVMFDEFENLIAYIENNAILDSSQAGYCELLIPHINNYIGKIYIAIDVGNSEMDDVDITIKIE